MEKRRIVPAQCAEYRASSVRPSIPNPTEYKRQRKAKITGYQLKMKSFMFYLIRFELTYCPRFSST